MVNPYGDDDDDLDANLIIDLFINVTPNLIFKIIIHSVSCTAEIRATLKLDLYYLFFHNVKMKVI